MLCLCLLLGFGKRRAELAAGAAHRPALAGYSMQLLEHLIQLNAVLVVTTFLLFLQGQAPLGRYAQAAVLGIQTRWADVSEGIPFGDSEFDGPELGRLQNHAGRPEVREAMRGVTGVARRVSASAGDEERFRDSYRRLGRLGLPLHPYEQAWADVRRLRADYPPERVAATQLLLVPLEFRHQTARVDITRSG